MPPIASAALPGGNTPARPDAAVRPRSPLHCPPDQSDTSTASVVPAGATRNGPAGPEERFAIAGMRGGRTTSGRAGDPLDLLRGIERLLSSVDARQVYFIQAVSGGPIKIGVTNNVERRLRTLQCGAPSELRVIAVTEGGRGDEARLHRLLARHRIHGEWFADCQEVRAVINELASLDRETESARNRRSV